ncbi:heavy metal-associated isoprenylated plant protein 23 [Brachypodium distachyon]|uniref:Heavy-metal associated domain protein n=1 Tax=Brachypodium distachyon TaxID=15368 RepID=C3SA91_BRADI|nr:heavy metal-associated isoprenylated plant protein 23 [Brachypodium distachyon]ACF22725.1 heavy-metal associated domain protein [Brachypodium distachyon]KQK21477.1 hypothetical protein BRADI_1g60990v3 [Brachypodium distachyon]|eukprot:XP_003557809.1 heavy metal-associated isoprenylated plant protein 23 [Brachypodium distachyon]
MGGTLEYMTGLLGGRNHHGVKSNERRQLQTVELKVRMDCEGCELKVKNALSSLKGLESVRINRKQQKVTVKGRVEAGKVLKKAQSTGKKAELWPCTTVSMPYVAASYDRRAPPGHVRRVEPTAMPYVSSSHVSRPEDRLTDMFNDDNPNACSVM